MSHALQHAATCQPRSRLSLLARLVAAVGVARQRRHLHNLDDHLLRDIGITRDQATREARKAPWDAPHNWKIRDN